MLHQIEIERATNGWILRIPREGDDEQPTADVTLHADDPGDDDPGDSLADPGSKASWAELLRQLTDALGPGYNKWGRREIHVDLRPGHKCDTEADVGWFLREVAGLSAPPAALAASITASIEAAHGEAIWTVTTPPIAGEVGE